jgi:hypothetical protein
VRGFSVIIVILLLIPFVINSILEFKSVSAVRELLPKMEIYSLRRFDYGLLSLLIGYPFIKES